MRRSSYKKATGSFAFSLLVGLLLNLVLVALLNVAIALEDPFDNVGLDGIYWYADCSLIQSWIVPSLLVAKHRLPTACNI